MLDFGTASYVYNFFSLSLCLYHSGHQTTTLVKNVDQPQNSPFGCNSFSTMKPAWIIYTVFLLGAVHVVCTASEEHKAALPPDEEHGAPVTSVLKSETVTGVLQSEAVTSAAAGNHTADNSTYPEYIGFITAGVAVVFYGSNFVPVKKFETGDGM